MKEFGVPLIVGWLAGWFSIVVWVWVQAARTQVRREHTKNSIEYDPHLTLAVILGLAWPGVALVMAVVWVVLKADGALRKALTPKPVPTLEAATYRTILFDIADPDEARAEAASHQGSNIEAGVGVEERIK